VFNICVYADTSKARPVAIIVPVETTLENMARENGIHAEHYDELIYNERLNSIVLKHLQATGRAAKLKGIELIDGVVLANEEWTPQNVSIYALLFVLWSIMALRVLSLPLRNSTGKKSLRNTRRTLTRRIRKLVNRGNGRGRYEV
jgi:long-subunit acyl-CoA synthetase (AMP-forming)